jgi:hypothetical protein
MSDKPADTGRPDVPGSAVGAFLEVEDQLAAEARASYDAAAGLAKIMRDPEVAVLPGGKRPAGPVYRTIIALDLEESAMRTNPVKGELRRVMYDLLGRSLEAVAVTGNRLEPVTDRGDGVLVLVKPHDEVPKTAMLDRLIPLLATLLGEYNAQAATPALQMRLRVIMHAGEVHMDARGCYGAAIDVAVRLLDSSHVKKALRQAAAPLVLVVSEEIHSGIVRHGYVDASAYLPVWARVGSRRHRGWMCALDPRERLTDYSDAIDAARVFEGLGRCGLADGRLEYGKAALRTAVEIYQRHGAAEAVELASLLGAAG